MANRLRWQALVILIIISTLAIIPAISRNELLLAAADSAESKRSAHAPSQLIIKFRDSVTEDVQNQTLRHYSAFALNEVPQIGVKIIKVPEPALDAIKEALSNSGLVDYVERDVLFEPEAIPNDPYFSKQWHLNKIGAPVAWGYGKGDGVIIAILDSGVQADHPDLAGKLVQGYNFYDNNNDWSGSNVPCKHGTIVAGVAGASTNNGAGVASVSWNSKMMPLRVTDTSCYGYSSAMAKAIVYAADNGARVANISFRVPELPQALYDAAKYMYDKGGLVVVSSGNDAARYSVQNNPYVIHVGATESSDALATFSSYGPFVDFVAPGHAVYTSIYDGMYNYVSGTSFSAPVVSGSLSLLFSAKPTATPAQVYDALKRSAVDLGPAGYDEKYGWGRINVGGAIQEIVGSQSSADTIAPSVTPPPNMVVEADSSTGKVVAYQPATATDNVAVTSGPVCNPPSGSVFPIGTTTLLCTASDSSGNVGTASFTIIVRDTTAPTLMLPADISVEAVDNAGAVVTFDISATDSIDGPVMTYCTHASGSLFSVGATEVSCEATDSSGNTGSGGFSVVVSLAADTIPPQVRIVSPAADTVIIGTTTIAAAAQDDSHVSKLELFINNKLKASSTSGTTLDFSWNTRNIKDGSYTLKVIAYDDSGNKSTATVTVIVSNKGAR